MPDAQPKRVVVVGGYGAFGEKAVERLARGGDIDVVVAGRSLNKAGAFAARMSQNCAARVSAARIDAAAPDASALKALGAAVVLNASGPFQKQDYALARAAIAAGAHYVDLADARGFVTGITVLDDEARRAGVLVTSGASSVPALAAAIVDLHRKDFARLDSVEHGITPAGGYDPGLATTASILGGLGKPMPVLSGGKWITAFGWLGIRRIDIPGLGQRWMSDCDVPDIELFPRRYLGVRTVRFRAGLDVPLFQFSLWALAGLARYGVVSRPDRFASALMWLKRRLRFLGGTDGGMVVCLAGLGPNGQSKLRVVSLIVRENQGPFVPVIAAVVVARKLIRGAIVERGAMPCLGMMELSEFEEEVKDLPIEILASAT